MLYIIFLMCDLECVRASVWVRCGVMNDYESKERILFTAVWYSDRGIEEHVLTMACPADPWGELARPYPLIHVDAMPSISEDEYDVGDDEGGAIEPTDPQEHRPSRPWNDITPDSPVLARPYRFHHVDAMGPIHENTTSCDEIEVMAPSPVHGSFSGSFSGNSPMNRRGWPRN